MNKKVIFILWFQISSVIGIGQHIFTTQSQVDSFVTFVNDTSVNYTLIFKYKQNVPKSKQIKDLSGFNNNRIVGVRLEGFPWKDIPWFTNLENGGFEIYDMVNLETISGVRGYKGSGVLFNNCPSLASYPPKGMLKYCNSMYIENVTRDELIIDLSGVIKYTSDAAIWGDKIYLENNNIKRVIINDPNGAIRRLNIDSNKSMRYLEFQTTRDLLTLQLINNLDLDSIRGFKNIKMINISLGMHSNPKLSDICVMREALDSFYQYISPRNRQLFRLYDNGYYAWNYDRMWEADCEWIKYISVEENSLEKTQIEVFPNPASQTLNVILKNYKHVGHVRLYNIQGTSVLQKTVEGNEIQLNLSFLNRGIYFLEYKNEIGTIETQKVILTD